MIKLIFLVFALASIVSAQIKETAEPLLDHLSLWKPVTLEQLSIDIQNKNAANNVIPFGNQISYSGENLAYITQTGNYNAAIIEQTGSNNSANITQEGDYNYNKVVQDGDDIYTDTEQKGFYNYIYQDLTGSHLNYVLSQEGSNNKIVQVESNSPLQEYQVSQNGNGARLIIINGAWNR